MCGGAIISDFIWSKSWFEFESEPRQVGDNGSVCTKKRKPVSGKVWFGFEFFFLLNIISVSDWGNFVEQLVDKKMGWRKK